MSQPLIIAVPKGRILEEAVPLLRRAGIETVEPDQPLRARVVEGRKGPLAVAVEEDLG